MFTLSRHVLGLKLCVPVPLEWVITNVPLGKVTVSVELVVRVSVPPAVNTPGAMMLDVFEVAEVVISWKCSVPDQAVRALAPARPGPVPRPARRATRARHAGGRCHATASATPPRVSSAPHAAGGGRARTGTGRARRAAPGPRPAAATAPDDLSRLRCPRRLPTA